MVFNLNSVSEVANTAKRAQPLPQLWGDIKDKNWTAFYECIQTAREHNEADKDQLNKVEEAGHNAERSGAGFPKSLPEMSRIIGKHIK